MAEIKKINIGGTEYDLEAVKATKDASGNVITDTYMTKVNPTGSGNVSIGRKSGSVTGDKSVAIGENSIASASDTIAIGNAASATNKWAVAIGADAKASGEQSTAIGTAPNASGKQSLALGVHTNAAGEYSTAMGCWTNSNGVAGTSLGNGSTVDANSWSAVSSGIVTTARGLGQHVFGSYNIPDAAVDSYSTPAEHLMIVGNGDVLSDDGVQSNAMTLDWDGNAWFSGDVYVGSTSGTNKDAGSKKLATQDEITTYTLTKSGSTITLTGSDGSTTSVTDSSANGVTVDSALSSTSTNPVQNKVINSALAGKSDTGHTHNYVDKVTSTNKAITRFNGTGGAVQDSKIIIEDTTNDRDQSKGQVIAIPTTGNRKMVYGLCTDQIDGTAFIGGLFDSSTTSYPYQDGLAIGGSSGNLLWKGVKVATVSDLSGKSNTGHTHSDYVNQNAFSNVIVGSTTIAADTTTDTLTLVAGSNITLTPDATNDKITIAATDTKYTHPSYTAKSSGLYKVTVDSTGHVSATTAVAKSDITALGIPSQDTTYSAATTSAAGLMSASDKSKLDAITASADAVSYTAAQTSGTKIGTITINGAGTDIYAPENTGSTYTAGTGISISGTTINNSGVRSIATGSNNGTISVNTNGTSAEVAVKGLGSAAYTASTDYATASHSQAASKVTAGTFAGQVVAGSSYQTPGTSLLRNSKLVSADTDPTNNGEICWTYA